MKIYGLQKLTMLDFPGRIACTVFTGGCNLRCPFCHNAGLVLPDRLSASGSLMDSEELFKFLDSRRGLLDGVAVSGGEPLLWPDIEEFLSEIRARGFLVKLDTNGTRPEVLSHILDSGLVDYVAMDIKNSPERYAETVGIDGFDVAPVKQSVELVMSSSVDYEFRTTAVAGLHDIESISAAARWISGARRYFIQNFVDSGNLVASEGMRGLSPEEMRALRDAARQYVPSTELRGI